MLIKHFRADSMGEEEDDDGEVGFQLSSNDFRDLASPISTTCSESTTKFFLDSSPLSSPAASPVHYSSVKQEQDDLSNLADLLNDAYVQEELLSNLVDIGPIEPLIQVKQEPPVDKVFAPNKGEQLVLVPVENVAAVKRKRGRPRKNPDAVADPNAEASKPRAKSKAKAKGKAKAKSRSRKAKKEDDETALALITTDRKRARNAYNFFVAEQKNDGIKATPTKYAEMWKEQDEQARKRFDEQAEQEKIKYAKIKAVKAAEYRKQIRQDKCTAYGQDLALVGDKNARGAAGVDGAGEKRSLCDLSFGFLFFVLFWLFLLFEIR